MPRPRSGAALLCAALASACQSSASKPPEAGRAVYGTSAVAHAPAPRAKSEIAAEAVRSIEEGRFDHARNLLDELLLTDHLARARAELAAGMPEDALIAVDRALELAPESLAVRLLKADASLRLAEAKIQGGGGSAGLIEGVLEDALGYYRGCGETAHALFGASRAAWLLGRPDEALDLARRGTAQLALEEHELAQRDLGELGLMPERIHAEQVYAAYAGARAEAADATALFTESEDALARLLGRTSDDPWAWTRLSDLYEWEGRLAEAKSACERGLARAPEDAGLLERLARVGSGLEGAAASVLTFEAYVAAHPTVAAGRWQLAVARMQLALEGYKQTPRVLDPSAFRAAEDEFRALRESAPEFAEAALGYELVARLGRGWCAFHAGDLALAQSVFLSMNELSARGVEWALPGELESGIQGLFFVADAHNQKGENLAAGEIFELLHGFQPDSVLWANNAGFFLRDAAYELEVEGQHLCDAASGRTANAEVLAEQRKLAGLEATAPGSEAERSGFVRAADERFDRARAIMARSWRAYAPAAALAPDDVRVVNDAALVLVYYLHHDLELAEQWLLRCVELGGPQLEAKKAALAVEESPERASALEAEIELLSEAWGDAHQNLGVLEWVHRKNAAAARKWLEKSLEIWPDRPGVTNSLLPQVRGESAPGVNDPWDHLNWAKPCRVP